MTTLIERAAQAAYEAAYKARWGGSGCWDVESESTKAMARIQARAVLEAIREPTEAMIEAARVIRPMCDDPPTSAEDYWDAMIDAALAEKT